MFFPEVRHWQIEFFWVVTPCSIVAGY